MIRSFFILLSLAGIGLAPNHSFGQAFIQWGEVVNENRNCSNLAGFNLGEAGFFLIHKPSKGLLVRRFSQDLKTSISEYHPLKEGKKNRKVEFVLELKNKLWAFTSFPNKKTKTDILYAETINPSTLEIDNDAKVIAEKDKGLVLQAEEPKAPYLTLNPFTVQKFHYAQSPDGRLLAIYYRISSEKGQEIIQVQVFDEEMKPVTERDIVIPYSVGNFRYQDLLISNDRNFYVLGFLSSTTAQLANLSQPKRSYVLLQANTKEEVKQHAITVPDRNITYAKIGIRKEGEVFCTGFYSEKNYKSIAGSFFTSLNPQTNGLSPTKTKDFEFDLVTQDYGVVKKALAKGKEKKRGKEAELAKIDIKEMFIREDGSVVFLAEKNYIEYLAGYKGNRYSSTNDIAYNYFLDILVVNIDVDGEISWHKRIPKRQISINDNGLYSSYVAGLLGSKLLIMFNDHPDNYYIKDPSEVNTYVPHKESIAMRYTIFQDGTESRNVQYKIESGQRKILPHQSKQISEKEILLFVTETTDIFAGYGRLRTYVLGRLTTE